MIRSGRCDACRQRKVKCDESRPSCRRCVGRNQICHYGEVTRFVDESSKQQTRFRPSREGSDSSNDEQEVSESTPGRPPMRHWQSSSSNTKIILSVRSARGVGKGHGLFQTLIPVHFQPESKNKTPRSPSACSSGSKQRQRRIPRSSPVHCISSSDTTALAAEFASFLEQVNRDQARYSALGSWMDSIPSRIGQSTVLDNAAACMIDGYNSFRHNHDQQFTKAAHRSYAKNLAELRKALLDPLEVGRSETIASVKLLTAFEIFMGDRLFAWVSHCRGVTKMLLAGGPQTYSDNFGRALYYSTYMQAYQDAMFTDQPSPFDSEEWLNVRAPDLPQSECHHLPAASKLCMQFFTKLPRLGVAVRAVREDPSNHSTIISAVELAEELFRQDLKDWERYILTECVKVVPTASAEDAILVPMSFSFDSFFTFETLVKYWMYRITLLGLISTLCAHVDSDLILLSDFYLPSIFEEELQCATYIAMCADHAERNAPFGYLTEIAPLQVAYGAWYRCTLREQMDAGTAWNRAMTMKEWSINRSNCMLRAWRTREASIPGLDIFWDAMMGGPPLPWVSRFQVEKYAGPHPKSPSDSTALPDEFD